MPDAIAPSENLSLTLPPGDHLAPNCQVNRVQNFRSQRRRSTLITSEGRSPHRKQFAPRAYHCERCGKAARSWMPQARFCSAACRQVRRYPVRQLVCPVCEAQFSTTRSQQKFCSPLCTNRDKCRRRYKAGTRRRFPKVEPAQRRLILERDGWRCGFCRAVIDPALRWPHPGSASIDHIDPLGAHEPANWQASHLACNVQAGAKGRRAVA